MRKLTMVNPLIKPLKKSQKSQMFSLDMIIALGVFVVILIASAIAWDSARERIYLQEQRNDLESIARAALSSLLLTPGEPAGWHTLDSANFNEVNVKSIGLTDSVPYKLRREKILYLEGQNRYITTKNILGIIGPGYEFHLNITVYDGAVFTESFQIGLSPDETAKEIVVVERAAVLDEKWAVIRIKAWARGDLA